MHWARILRHCVVGCALGLALVVGMAQARWVPWPYPAHPDRFQPLRIVGTVLSDNGDADNWADSRETIRLRLILWNRGSVDLTHIVARLSSDDPGIACIRDAGIVVERLAAGETVTTEDAFELVVGDVERGNLAEELSATFAVTMTGAQFTGLPQPLTFTLDLDLDADGGSGPTAFHEGFESGFGRFTTMHLDQQLNPPEDDLLNFDAGMAAADGYRCQYSDPDWASTYSAAALTCFPNPDGLPDAYHWGVTTNRAVNGLSSMYFGIDRGEGELATPRGQLEAVGTKEPVNLGWSSVCSATRSLPCTTEVNCPPGESCVATSPILSFKQQVSFVDTRVAYDEFDRGVVMAREVDAEGTPLGPWFKLEPFENLYDRQMGQRYSSCFFDPVDDGNTEEDFFDPEDPERRFGPSSTCYPEFAYFWIGSTTDEPHRGRGTDGPEFPGQSGEGTWMQSRFDLSRYRGRRLELRFLVSTYKYRSSITWGLEGYPYDDGWFVDDVEVSDTIVTAAAITPDAKDSSRLPTLEDLDEDGLACDNCPTTSNAEQADGDGDGMGDACDPCPQDAFDDADGDGRCCEQDNCCSAWNPDQADSDADGIGDACDNCPSVANPEQIDRVVIDGVGDACADADADGVPDADDLCPLTFEGQPADEDADGVGDACDNCPAVYNPSQQDYEADGIGDLCDYCWSVGYPDADDDCRSDERDNCPSVRNTDQADQDGDGVGDVCDNCPSVWNPTQSDVNGDGVGDSCTRCPDPLDDGDGDGRVCGEDNCPELANPDQADADADGLGDPCDPCALDPKNDVDRDGVCGNEDNCPTLAAADQGNVLVLADATDLEGYRLTPSGSHVVYGRQNVGLFAVRLSGGSPARLDEVLNWPINRSNSVVITPDERSVLFTADTYTDPTTTLFRTALDGSELAELATGDDAISFELSPDGSRVVYRTEQGLLPWGFEPVEALFGRPLGPGPTVRLNPTLVPGGQIINSGFRFFLDGESVFYKAAVELPERVELYRTSSDASTTRKVNLPIAADESIAGDLFPDRNRAIYRVLPDGSLFVTDFEGPPVLLSDKAGSWRLSADGSTVVLFADRRFYAIPAAGGEPVSLTEPFPEGRELSAYSLVGDRVVYLSHIGDPAIRDLYGVPIAGGPTSRLSPELSEDEGVRDYVEDPDGEFVVFRVQNYDTDTLRLFSASVQGGAPRLHGTDYGGLGPYYVLTPDRTTIVYAAGATPDNLQIHAVDVAGGDARVVSGDVDLLRYWSSFFEVTPDSRAVVYVNPDEQLKLALLAPDPDQDGILSVCDCGPDDAAVYPGAEEINDGLDNQCDGDRGFGLIDEVEGAAGFADTVDTFSWPVQPGAARYQVVRAADARFISDCTVLETSSPEWLDLQRPSTGSAFYYLVRAYSPFPGSWGARSLAEPREVPCVGAR